MGLGLSAMWGGCGPTCPGVLLDQSLAKSELRGSLGGEHISFGDHRATQGKLNVMIRQVGEAVMNEEGQRQQVNMNAVVKFHSAEKADEPFLFP